MKKILFTLFAIFSALAVNAQTLVKVTMTDGTGSGAFTISDVKEITFVDETVLWAEDPVVMTWTNVATFDPSVFTSCEVGAICRFYTTGTGQISTFAVPSDDSDWTTISNVSEWNDSGDNELEFVLTEDIISTISSASSIVVQGADITLNKITLIP